MTYVSNIQLHSILPRTEGESIALATAGNYPVTHVKRKFNSLRDENPAIGLRGCRLFILYPGTFWSPLYFIFQHSQESYLFKIYLCLRVTGHSSKSYCKSHDWVSWGRDTCIPWNDNSLRLKLPGAGYSSPSPSQSYRRRTCMPSTNWFAL